MTTLIDVEGIARSEASFGPVSVKCCICHHQIYFDTEEQMVRFVVSSHWSHKAFIWKCPVCA